MTVNGTVANASVNVHSTEGEVLFNITAFDLAGNLTVTQTNLTSSNLTIITHHSNLRYTGTQYL